MFQLCIFWIFLLHIIPGPNYYKYKDTTIHVLHTPSVQILFYNIFMAVKRVRIYRIHSSRVQQIKIKTKTLLRIFTTTLDDVYVVNFNKYMPCCIVTYFCLDIFVVRIRVARQYYPRLWTEIKKNTRSTHKL